MNFRAMLQNNFLFFSNFSCANINSVCTKLIRIRVDACSKLQSVEKNECCSYLTSWSQVTVSFPNLSLQITACEPDIPRSMSVICFQKAGKKNIPACVKTTSLLAALPIVILSFTRSILFAFAEVLANLPQAFSECSDSSKWSKFSPTSWVFSIGFWALERGTDVNFPRTGNLTVITCFIQKRAG